MNSVCTKFVISDDVTFKYAKGASVESGKEFHAFHEIIYFMGGTGKFISENIQTSLKPNSLIILPRETYHQLTISGNQDDYQRCVFHFLDVPEFHELISLSMKSTRIIEMNQRLFFIFQNMISLFDNSYSESLKSEIMKSTLCLLLNEISSNNYTDIELPVPNTLSERCINYITQHINEPLIADDIAKEFNISVSHLSHTFKKQMHISLHQFILKKKLVMAHHKILDGVPATKAAVECGFNDYSGFYKQFKKMFNKSPSSRGSGIEVE